MKNRLSQTTTSQSGESSPNSTLPKGKGKRRGVFIPIFLMLVGCAVFAFAAYSAVNSPAMAAILNGGSNSLEFQQIAPGRSYAQVYIVKPTYTPIVAQAQAQPVMPAATASQIVQPQMVEVLPTQTITPQVENLSTATATLQAVVATESSPVVANAVIVPDTPTPEFAAPTAVAVAPVTSPGEGVRWFDVDLSDQRMYAYEGDTLVRTFIVSTGTWQTPTVTGRFKVWVKLRSAPMSGPGYYLPNVPYIMYFHGDYGIHGTYWHNNFGVPMSHGCVNLNTEDAEWAYNFASVGTIVNVHD